MNFKNSFRSSSGVIKPFKYRHNRQKLIINNNHEMLTLTVPRDRYNTDKSASPNDKKDSAETRALRRLNVDRLFENIVNQKPLSTNLVTKKTEFEDASALSSHSTSSTCASVAQ